MKIHNVEQGSPEWFELRKGKLTASHGTAIGNSGKGLLTYVDNIILAMFIDKEFKDSKDTLRGKELEPFARIKYEFETGNVVKEVGFIEHCSFSGCSPDGLIGEDGGLEIKCRNDPKHLKLLLGGSISSDTIWQIQMCLLVTGRKWWDFASYNPNFKQSIVLRKVLPDVAKMEALSKGIEKGKLLIQEALNNEAIKVELNEIQP